MDSMKSSASRCTLIGDIVGSRGSVDRADLHRAVEATLRQVDDAVLDAGLRVRLALLPDVDTRIGIGRGSVTTLDPDRGIEDGPGWWAARSAVEAAEEAAAKPATRHVRTALRVAPSEDDTAVDAVNAALLCRDHLVGSCSERSIRLLRGLMQPHTTQGDLATLEGISPSAVSQRVRADGLGAVLAAHDLLRRMP